MFSIFIFLIQVVFSLYLLGAIWFIQIVHYPLFIYLKFDSTHNPFSFQHSRSGIALMIAMILELISALILLFIPYPNFLNVLILFIFSVLTWITTLTIQIPSQNLLKNERNENVIFRLIWTNWLRTALWTLKAIYIFFLLWNLLTDTFIIITKI